jgi:hypothetical protein
MPMKILVLGIILSITSAAKAADNNALDGAWRIATFACEDGTAPKVDLAFYQTQVLFSFSGGNEIVTYTESADCTAVDTGAYKITGSQAVFTNRKTTFGHGCGPKSGKILPRPDKTFTFSINGNGLQMSTPAMGEKGICPPGVVVTENFRRS